MAQHRLERWERGETFNWKSSASKFNRETQYFVHFNASPSPFLRVVEQLWSNYNLECDLSICQYLKQSFCFLKEKLSSVSHSTEVWATWKKFTKTRPRTILSRETRLEVFLLYEQSWRLPMAFLSHQTIHHSTQSAFSASSDSFKSSQLLRPEKSYSKITSAFFLRARIFSSKTK